MNDLINNVKTFPCPNRGKYINNLTTTCKYCLVPLNMQTVADAVDSQDLRANAHYKARNARIFTGLMIATFFLSIMASIGLFPGPVIYVTFFAVPILCIFYLFKLCTLCTLNVAGLSDKEAKKYCWTALFIWLGFLAFSVIFRLLF